MNNRSKFFFYFFVLAFITSESMAQWNVSLPDTASTISINGSSELYNNSLRNDWVFWLMGGKVPSQEAQKTQQRELATTNTLLATGKAGFHYQQMDSARTNGWYVAGTFNQLTSTTLSKDAADLFLNGNGHMEDYDADISNSTFLRQQWQTVKAGVIRKTPKGWLTYSGGLVTGTSQEQVNISSGSIFTEKNGEYLDLEYSGFRRSANFGMGLSFGLRYSHVVDESQKWQFSINDLGAVYWWSGTQRQEKDTQFRYKGVIVDDASTWNSSSLENQLDSLSDELLGKINTNGFGTALPTRMQFQYTYSFDPIHQLSLGADIQFAGNTLYHMQWITHHWNLTPLVSVHSGIDAIQLRALNWREEVRVNVKTGWFGLGLTGLDAPIVPSESGGVGAAFSAGLYLH